MRVLRIIDSSPYHQIIGIGGIGTGMFFALQGEHTLGRNESRAGVLLDARDYCKLHIVLHYVAKLVGGSPQGIPFRVVPIGIVGNDDSGLRLREEMRAAGMDVSCIRQHPQKPTLFSLCFQYPGGDGGNITTSNSAAAELSAADLDQMVPSLLASASKRTIAVAVPEVPLEVRWHFLELATKAGAFRAGSFVPGEIASARAAGFFSLLDLLAVNQAEAAELLGLHLSPQSPQEFIAACLRWIESKYPGLKMIVSAGEHGAYAFSHGTWGYSPAPDTSVVSTAGAGDALLGGVLAGLACGCPLLGTGAADPTLIESALDLGVLLGSFKCLSPHSIHPSASLEALIEFASGLGLQFSRNLDRHWNPR